MPESPEPDIYHLRIVLLGISPIIWRCLLVRGDSTIVDLHNTLQTAFGWSDDQLHRFLIPGKQYGVTYLDGITFRDDPRLIKFSDLGLRVKEKFRLCCKNSLIIKDVAVNICSLLL
jgi:Plasmid pRiA4b ORF-3-like protein